jgi:hypothetical protein
LSFVQPIRQWEHSFDLRAKKTKKNNIWTIGDGG